jgi:hypothetical protein
MGERVRETMTTLEARGEAISCHTVNRYLRSVPPYIGASYRDLLPLLRNQRVPTEAEQAEQDILSMAQACEEAMTNGASRARLQSLIADSEKLWQRVMPLMLRASARGEDTGAFVIAFERLRDARSALILAPGRKT